MQVGRKTLFCLSGRMSMSDISFKRVHIVNNGGPGYTTEIRDAETGEMLDRVTGIHVELDIDVKNMPKAIITTYAPVVDVIADAEFKQVCPCCGRPVEVNP